MFLRNHGHNKDVRPPIPIRKSENTNKIIYQTKSYVNKVKDFTQCDPNEYKKHSANVETATLDNESNNIAKDLIHKILETIPPDAPIDTTELNSVDNTESNSIYISESNCDDNAESNSADNTDKDAFLDASLVDLDNDEVTDNFGDPITDPNPSNDNSSSTTDSLNY